MEKGEKLKRFVISSGYDMGEVAKKAGISQSYLSQILNGHKDPKMETISKVLKAIDMTEAMFFTEMVKVPVIARISAGQGIYPVSQDTYPVGEGLEEIPAIHGYWTQEQVYNDGLYALQIVGDSMLPTMADGDYIYIKPCPLDEIHKGSFVIFRDHEGMGFVKKINNIIEDTFFFEGIGDGQKLSRHISEIAVIEKVLDVKKA